LTSRRGETLSAGAGWTYHHPGGRLSQAKALIGLNKPANAIDNLTGAIERCDIACKSGAYNLREIAHDILSQTAEDAKTSSQHFQLALQDFTKAIELDPVRSVGARLNRARYYLRMLDGRDRARDDIDFHPQPRSRQ
jgi:hypothetical protein